MHIKQIAEQLGISRRQVHVLKNRGMPVDCIHKAIAWRKENLVFASVKNVRADSNPGK